MRVTYFVIKYHTSGAVIKAYPSIYVSLDLIGATSIGA